MIVRIGTYTLDVPPSLLVWLTLALLLMLGLAFAGKKIACADPRHAPRGAVLWALQLDALCRKLCGKQMEASRYAFFATLIVMLALANLAGLLALPLPAANLSVTLALAKGTSIVTESIFENRFKYVDELARMGANIKVEGNTAIIDGTEKLTGARISAPDLRAGAALVIAGLAGEGITVVDDIVYIQRGYEDFDAKLRALGAEIEKVSSEKEIQKFRMRVG